MAQDKTTETLMERLTAALKRALAAEERVAELEQQLEWAERDKAQAGRAMQLYAEQRDAARAERDALLRAQAEKSAD